MMLLCLAQNTSGSMCHRHLKPGSQDDARLAFVPIKIKLMECTRAWLLNSSCSDVLLATQE